MEKNEFQSKMLFYIMLESIEEISKVDEEFQEELEVIEGKIQWNIGNFKGYQIFENGKYSFKIDAEIEEPDLTMILPDVDIAKSLLTGEIDGTSAYMSGDLTIEGNLQIAMAYTALSDFILEYLEPITPGG